MGTIDKPYTFHTFFNEKFKVSQHDLGRKPDSSMTDEAKDNFLKKEVDVTVTEIVIPKMQRDYAQGRPNTVEVRENFLQVLYEALVDNSGKKRCALNFVYGHFLESHERADAVSFVPYDGQQRLTTLCLLHWYASRRDAVGGTIGDDLIRGFRYDTRFSSTTFTTMFLAGISNLQVSEAEAKWLGTHCGQNVVKGDMVPVGMVDGEGIFFRWLTNKNAFAKSWLNDPTVRGMLTMLDAIHAKFHDVPNLWQRLCETDPAKFPIYFFFQPVARNSEAGSIFIKMNSRGKLLTEFECFKADFLRLLRKGGCPDDKREKLAEKINKTWELAFWKLANRHNLVDTDTDVLLMRYVNFVIDLIGFERNLFDKRNVRLHLYNSERFKKVLLSSDGMLNYDVIEELTEAIDTWCGDGPESRGDEYFQKVFRKEDDNDMRNVSNPDRRDKCSQVRLFFKPDPGEFFSTIILGKELSMNALAIFHAVLIARRIRLSQELFDLRLRSIRNLVFHMDKAVTELPYILQKVRLIIKDGLSVDFRNGESPRKFTDSQIREERFKEWLASQNPSLYKETRTFEESDWFKGQVGALLHEVLDVPEEQEKLSLLETVFVKRMEVFKKLFCSGPIPDSVIRKALFTVLEGGFDYWVLSRGKFWMGASTYDYSWTAEHPYFTREGKSQEALRRLLDNPFFASSSGNGKGLLESFSNRNRECDDCGDGQFGAVYYLNHYYDDFFEKWTQDESGGNKSCVGCILPGHAGLTMQMLSGKTRRSLYWDPYLYVALKAVDKDSIKDPTKGKFANLYKQNDAWHDCRIVHRESETEIWNDPFGVKVKARREFFNIIQTKICLQFEEVHGDAVETSDDGPLWLFRTRKNDDKTSNDHRDRIGVCKELLKAIIDASSAEIN